MAAGAAGAQRGADRYQEEKLMDEHLKANGLYRRRIAKDGSCLFRAVAEQVLHCQGLHTSVRAQCVKYLRQNRELYESFIEGDFDEYLQRLQDPQSWVGQVEISALAVLYKHDFIIYQNPGEPPVYVTENGYPKKVQLCFLNGNHYDSVYPASFSKNAAMCQSILYELLYERVCGVDRNVVASNMRGTKVRDESEESDLDEGENFWSSEATGKTTSVNSRPPYRGRGRGQTRGGGRGFLPNKVQDSLNPCHFRNVEYDVWMKSKKAQQRRDFCMAAGMQYAVGDKCQVQLTGNGRYFNAYIEDVSPNDGPVTVFIEELGEKHTVSLWNLRPPSDDSWSTEKGKRHSVSDNNEWETRGGRKPARSVSIPYGPAGSAPSSNLQKQHSWPPQAPAEPQGKNANSRKSDQDVGVLGVSPAEEEELLVLELLHKDENNFPPLEASAQAAAASGSGETGRRADKKGSKKKPDTETKESLQKPDQKAERGKHKKKGSVGQEQPISPPVKEKLSLSPPAVPPSAISPIPSAPVATKPNPASLEAAPTPTPAQTAPACSQTAPVPSKTATISAGTATSRSETVSAASTLSAQAAPASSPQTTSVPAPSPAHFQPTPALPQATALPTPALPQATAVPTHTQSFLTTPITTHALSAQTTPVPTPALPQTTAVPTHTLSAQPTPVPTYGLSAQTTPVPTPSPFPQTTPVLTSVPTSTPTTHASSPALPPTTPVPTPAHSQSTPVPTHGHDPTHLPSQFAPATISAMTTPAPSHSIPTLPVSDSEVPAQSNPCPAEFSVDSRNPPALLPLSAHIPSNLSHAQHSVTPPAPVNVSAASSLELSSSFAPFHPAGHGTLPVLAHCPPYMAPVPTSAPMLTPHAASSSAPPSTFPHPSEPRPCEPAASPVAGMGSATVPEFMPHGLAAHPQHPQPPQHSTPLTQLSQLYQDPLYPGFPLNDQDEPAKIPPFSHLPTGKDLPTDARVLRFFFNLGVKAFTNPLYPPLSYLTPLRQAHFMKPKVPPPAPSSSPYPPPWQPDNTPSILQMTSTPNPTHHSLPVDSLGGGNSAGHFEMQGLVPGPSPVNIGGYGAPPNSVPVQPMHPQPAVPWNFAPGPSVYTGIYSAPPAGQFPAHPPPPQGGQPYHSTSVRHPLLPGPPPQYHGMNVAMAAVAPAIERGDAGGKRSTPPVTSNSFTTYGPMVHSGGEVGPQQVGRASPGVHVVSAGSVPRESAESATLANGNQRLDYNATSFQGLSSAGLNMYMQPSPSVNELDLEEAEYGTADLRSGRSYYGRSFHSSRRRGHDERGGGGGGFRGRSSRGRRDNTVRENQPYYSRGYNSRGRGRGYVQPSNAGEAGYQGGAFTPAAKT